MNPLACPDAEALERYSRGLISDADAAKLADHLTHCDHCLAALHTLHLEDSLIDLLNRPGPAKNPQRDAHVALVVQRLGALRDESKARPKTAEHTGPARSEPVPPPLPEWDFLAPPQGPGELGRLGGYRILKLLGRGGMGLVFQAEDPRLKRLVAVKVLRPDAARDSLAAQRFLREAQSAAALKHDHIVTIYQVGEERGIPFLVMELLEGESLEQRLEREGQLPSFEALRIGRETAAGLAAAHQRGLIHRDVKPGNLWLEGKRGRVKILDFGLARPIHSRTPLTQLGAVLGTPAYMAPEQIQGKNLDHRCDLFSLGCVLYQLVAGRLPFRGEDRVAAAMAILREAPTPPQGLNPAPPPKLANLLLQLLAKNPDDRPWSAAAVAAALKTIEKEQALVAAASSGLVAVGRKSAVGVAPSASAGEGPQRVNAGVLARRGGTKRVTRRAPLSVFAAAAILVVVIVCVFWWAPHSPSPPAGSDKPSAGDASSPAAGSSHPLDALRRQDVPLEALTAAGGGDPKNAPAQLVAVFDMRPDGKNEVVAVTFSPDGRLLAASSGRGGPWLWDLATKKVLLARPPQSVDRCLGLGFSPDGKLLAFGRRNEVVLLEAPSGRVFRVLTPNGSGHVYRLAFSPTERVLATGSSDGVVNRWEWSLGKELPVLPKTLQKSPVVGLANSPDGKTFASAGSTQRGVTVWDASTGMERESFPTHIYTTGLAFSADGRQLARSGNSTTGLLLWDVGMWDKPRRLIQKEAEIGCVAFRPVGHALAAGVAGIRVWDLTADTEVTIPFTQTKILSLAYSADGRYLAAGSSRGTVYILRVGP